MFKKIWFQVHWFIGITAGTVLMAIGVTGATLSFREEILDWINPGLVHVAVQQAAPLTPQQLLERVQAAEPGQRVSNLTVYAEAGMAARVNFAPPPGVRRGEQRLVNPYTGALLPPLSGREFFEVVERFHRWLLLPVEYGKLVAGSLSLCLFILALSGLYLRWPRRALNWRAWFRLDFGLSGRPFLWNLHSVVGTWALVMYLIFTSTGMYWAFDWVRSTVNGLAGEATPMRGAPPQANDAGAREANRAGAHEGAREGERNGAHDKQAQQASAGRQRDGEADTGKQPQSAKADRERAASGARTGQRDKREQGNQHEHGDAGNAAPLDLTAAWNSFLHTAGNYTQVSLRLPERGSPIIQFTYLTPDAAHERARNRMNIVAQSGAVKLDERFAEKSRGSRFIGAIYALHMGSYFGLPGRIIMTLASLIMPLFGITGWMLYLDRRRKKRALRAERQALADGSHGNDGQQPVLVAYASQAGHAERLALLTAGALQDAGVAIEVQSLNGLNPERLRHYQRMLLVVSTFGEGEPPDLTRRFAQQLARQQGNLLSHVEYGLLALGDRNYTQFCGFGHTLDHDLRNLGAQALFPLIEVDNNDAAALQRWQQELSVFTGGRALADGNLLVPAQPYQQWRLRNRRLLNAGSCGQPLYHLELDAPADSGVTWQSGALAEILPRHAPERVAAWLAHSGLDGNSMVDHQGHSRTLAAALAGSILPAPAGVSAATTPQQVADKLHALGSRRYSVASTAQDGSVHLLVRQVLHEDGLGLASGWLTEHAALDQDIELRLLENRSFLLNTSTAPAIFIGNGSGLAGLRGHLRARQQRGMKRNWLLFGERQRAHDFLYQNEIEAWLQDGTLERADLAFSRDQAQRVYVQDKLRAAAAALTSWIADGAVLYICGSLDGMAAGVDAALTDILGAHALQDLIAQGRYRRDVY